MATATDTTEDAVKVAGDAHRAAVEDANTLRRRIVEGDATVTASDLAEADGEVELALLRVRAAEKLCARAEEERYQREQAAFLERVERLRKHREKKVDDLAGKVRSALDSYVAEAAAYESERGEVAGQAAHFGVTELPPPTRPLRTVLTHVSEAVRAFPFAHRSGMAAEIKDMTYRLREE